MSPRPQLTVLCTVRKSPLWVQHSGVSKLDFFFGDMTLVTYLRKSFSRREDDSRAPHFTPTLCQYNRLDRLVWEGLGFLLSLSSILNNFERIFYIFQKKSNLETPLCWTQRGDFLTVHSTLYRTQYIVPILPPPTRSPQMHIFERPTPELNVFAPYLSKNIIFQNVPGP